jgi:hypothetical protein
MSECLRKNDGKKNRKTKSSPKMPSAAPGKELGTQGRVFSKHSSI